LCSQRNRHEEDAAREKARTRGGSSRAGDSGSSSETRYRATPGRYLVNKARRSLQKKSDACKTMSSRSLRSGKPHGGGGGGKGHKDKGDRDRDGKEKNDD
jgi:hypothetical protein